MVFIPYLHLLLEIDYTDIFIFLTFQYVLGNCDIIHPTHPLSLFLSIFQISFLNFRILLGSQKSGKEIFLYPVSSFPNC